SGAFWLTRSSATLSTEPPDFAIMSIDSTLATPTHESQTAPQQSENDPDSVADGSDQSQAKPPQQAAAPPQEASVASERRIVEGAVTVLIDWEQTPAFEQHVSKYRLRTPRHSFLLNANGVAHSGALTTQDFTCALPAERWPQ